MAATRGSVQQGHRYTLDEAARFLQYDREAVAYWLRTGHLAGERDARSGEWLVTAGDLVAFIRASNEPMPTGATGALPAATGADTPGEVRIRVSISPN